MLSLMSVLPRHRHEVPDRNPHVRAWPQSGLILVGLSASLLGGCWLTPWAPAPGEGPKAERYYQRAEPIIDALATFHDERGHYPQSLDKLVPDYIASDRAPDGDWDFAYERTDEAYVLAFGYSGPGINHCSYSPERGSWGCTGYY